VILNIYCRRKLLVEIGAEGKSTTKKLSQALTIKRATLQRRIMRWTEIQGAYMPDVVLYRQRARETTVPIPQDIAIILLNHTSTTAQELDDSSSEQGDDSADEVAGSSGPTRVGIEAETFDLLLPSSETVIYNRLASQSLHDKEIRLRHAHLDTYLQELRRLLRIKSSAYVDKRKNVSGQKGGTRANSDIQKFNLKINCTVSSYQFTRGVLLRLDPSGPWQERLKPLLKADVRAPEQDDSDDEPDGGSHTQSLVHRIRRRVRAESKRQISWIWRIPRLADGPDEAGNEDTIGSGRRIALRGRSKLTDFQLTGVRVQWAKAQARAQRYAEEHGLLQDEMRRVCAYFEWKASWWRDRRRVGRVDASQRVKAGLDSYAEKQAAMLESLRAQFIGLWRPLLTDLGLPSSWMDQYSAQVIFLQCLAVNQLIRIHRKRLCSSLSTSI
jgi:hypothetical protein